MIKRLEPQQGEWSEDTARIMAKVNELIDTLNGEKKEASEPVHKKVMVGTAKGVTEKKETKVKYGSR